MEYRQLGGTGIRASVLGFGGAEIGYEGAPLEDVDRIVSSAIDAGVNVFDTAECYVDSEAKLGEALRGRRDQVFVFTKCGHASGLDGDDWNPKTLERSINRSLERLRTNHVDVLQLHSCSSQTLERGGVIEVLQRARQAGKTRFIGYSGDSVDARYAVDCAAFDTLQTSINIADQEAIDVTVPQAREAGMGIIAKRPIANAAWKYSETPPDAYHHQYWQRLRALRYSFLDGSLPDAVSVALRFTLAVDGVTMAIVGTKNPDRWRQNASMVNDGPLDPRLFESVRTRWREVAANDWVGQV
jgi:aryl-alcohol dehydrogenase-like predicted oxidoreductase